MTLNGPIPAISFILHCVSKKYSTLRLIIILANVDRREAEIFVMYTYRILLQINW